MDSVQYNNGEGVLETRATVETRNGLAFHRKTSGTIQMMTSCEIRGGRSGSRPSFSPSFFGILPS
jgi:hypothetical protein